MSTVFVMVSTNWTVKGGVIEEVITKHMYRTITKTDTVAFED